MCLLCFPIVLKSFGFSSFLGVLKPKHLNDCEMMIRRYRTENSRKQYKIVRVQVVVVVVYVAVILLCFFCFVLVAVVVIVTIMKIFFKGFWKNNKQKTKG